MRTRNSFSLVLATIVLAACARDETPIEFKICDAMHENCFVAARFKDMDACQSHDKWAGMLCDSVSQPGVMTCREPDRREPVVSTGYCSD